MLMDLHLQSIKSIISNDREKSYFEKLDAKCKCPLMELNKETHGTKEFIESSHEKFFEDEHIESELYCMPKHAKGIEAYASKKTTNVWKLKLGQRSI